MLRRLFCGGQLWQLSVRSFWSYLHRDRHTHTLRFNGHFSRWTRVSRLSMSFLTQSHQVFFGRPLCLIPSTSHVIQRLTQSVIFSFNMSKPSQPTHFDHQTDWFQFSNPKSSLSSSFFFLSFSLTPHIHLIILISALFIFNSCSTFIGQLLLLSCAKSHMLSASRRLPRLLHVSAVDRRQTWLMDKSWRCVTLSGFLHSHIVRCQWDPISWGTHYSGPGLSENDSAVTTDVCEDQNRVVGLWLQ